MNEQAPSGQRTAIVTGAASGIGRELARALAADGIFVALADRQQELAEEGAAEIRAGRGSAMAIELDVRDAQRFREVVQLVVGRTGRLDYLFNNAGIGVGGEIREFDAADWDDVIDVNLRGVAYGVLAAYPLMIAQGFGHIVNTASIAGLTIAPLQCSYTATKHAVVGLSRALRLEAEPHGVKVSVVCPGFIRTPILTGGRYGRFKPGMDRALLTKAVDQIGAMEPAALARRVLQGVAANRAIIVEPSRYRAMWYLDRLSTRLSHRLAGLILGELFKRAASSATAPATAQAPLAKHARAEARAAVRRLRVEDAEAIVALRREALSAHPLAFGASTTDDRSLALDFVRTALSNDGEQAIFGYVEGDLAGMVGIYREAEAKRRHRAHLWGMYVAPRARRSGAGRALLEAAIAAARAWPGVEQLHLSVTDAAAHARALYESAGFRVVGRDARALAVEGRFADEFLLVLDLAQESAGS